MSTIFPLESSGNGQVVTEFAFCMIIVMLLSYATIKAFQWSGVNLAERRAAHERTLSQPIDEKWGDPKDGPLKQLDTGFFTSNKMGMVFNKW